MAEDSALYWSLFQGQFPDEWRTDPDFLQYVSTLGAYSIEKLQLEPDHLAEERRLVLNSTQKLAFNNYQTFIETAECTREIFKDFVSVEQHVSELLDKIPGFVSAANAFTEESREVNEKRKLNSLALSKHTQLLEVLEIPQVMETCVRNGYYEEALDLSAHVKRLDKKHGSTSIIKAIAHDVEASMELMLTQLLQQLRGSIQLPACLRVVGFLRRMEVFSDVELRLKFLQARDCWLKGVLAAVPSDDPYHHLSKVVEASRVHLFDIVTQYRAIFPDDDTALAGYSAGRAGGGGAGMEGTLFYSWVGEKIWQFLRLLETDLQRGVGGRMDSLLSQCMYFGLSFSRIGADFRPLIAPVFIRVIIGNFRLSVRTAKHYFHESMKKLTLLTPLRAISSSSSSLLSSTTQPLSPPHSLLDFPPLSTLTNALITVFNDLRQCAPLVLGPEIARELQRLLESVVHDVGEYHRVEHASFSGREAEAYQQLCRVMVLDFLPFVKKCFETLFSAAAVEQLALTTPYALKHAERRGEDEGERVPVGRTTKHLDLNMELDVAAIGEALRPFAPEVFEEIERQTSLSLLSVMTEGIALEGDQQGSAPEPVDGGSTAGSVEPAAETPSLIGDTEQVLGSSDGEGGAFQAPRRLEASSGDITPGELPVDSVLLSPTATVKMEPIRVATESSYSTTEMPKTGHEVGLRSDSTESRHLAQPIEHVQPPLSSVGGMKVPPHSSSSSSSYPLPGGVRDGASAGPGGLIAPSVQPSDQWKKF